MTIVLPVAVRAAVVDHAREGAPEEVVGVLAGHRGGDVSTVERALRARNAADAPRTRYEIAPDEQLALLEQIEALGSDVVGFYHSHPRGPTEPSDVDAGRAAWPGHSYLIVSLAGESGDEPTDGPTGEPSGEPTDGPAVGSWRWTGERFREEAVEPR
ncbi:hypothetical protein BRC99_05635 [Halobacteriales archaeon QS_7_69_60]|nr:MAG: hypothetical protein BRC99_05635 [Halobacteriales archaeon QS_7_69_60]